MASGKLFGRIDRIRLENVSKTYEENKAVEDVTLEVRGGELLMIVGSGGCGKTTLVKMLNRLVEPDKGEILVNGISITGFDPPYLRRHIGYLMQDVGLFPHMSVRENLSLVPKSQGWARDRIKKRLDEVLELVALPAEDFLELYPRELSGGQQQRIGLARALVMDPPLLLLDDPFGGLDAILRKQLQDEFLKIKKRLGKTIVFATTDVDEAFKLGDRIAVMETGKIIQTGPADELIINPSSEFVSRLVDSKKMFRHVDNLRVGDVMMPVDKRYVFDASTDAETAVSRMYRDEVEFGIVLDGQKIIGVVYMLDLIKAHMGAGKISELAKKPIVLSPSASLFTGLAELKSKGAPIALVETGEGLRGMLLADEVLMKLV